MNPLLLLLRIFYFFNDKSLIINTLKIIGKYTLVKKIKLD